jgi:hypothetical protein
VLSPGRCRSSRETTGAPGCWWSCRAGSDRR